MSESTNTDFEKWWKRFVLQVKGSEFHEMNKNDAAKAAWNARESEIAKLKDALRFYADKANYDFVKGTSLIIPIYEDVGAKAREALNSKKGEES